MRPVVIALLAFVPLFTGCEGPSPVADQTPPAEAAAQAPSPGPLPLARILEIAAHATPGEVVKVELENEHGVLAYELKIVTGRGRLIELQIDARTGAILKREAE